MRLTKLGYVLSVLMIGVVLYFLFLVTTVSRLQSEIKTLNRSRSVCYNLMNRRQQNEFKKLFDYNPNK